MNKIARAIFRRPVVGMKLVVGLGNPGAAYRRTRHNAGAAALEALADRHGLAFKNNRSLKCLMASGEIGAHSVILALPQTYMNLSGEAVVLLLKKRQVRLKDLLVVCDDVALALGRLRLKTRGSGGGHNGLASVIERLGSTEFNRLRLGIGEKPQGRNLADYVLDKFHAAEEPACADMIKKAVAAIEAWLDLGLERSMNAVNSLTLQRSQKATDLPIGHAPRPSARGESVDEWPSGRPAGRRARAER